MIKFLFRLNRISARQAIGSAGGWRQDALQRLLVKIASRTPWAPQAAGTTQSWPILAFQIFQLGADVFPFLGIRQGRHGFGDGRPFAGQVQIDFDELLLVGGDIFFGVDRIDRAFGHAYCAVDAFVRIDHQKIGAYAKAINRAHIDAVGISAADAGFGDNVGHNIPIYKTVELF
jgi:hypothetical protein